jgi:tetratricopeptide (TPR) repeat protein
MNTEALPSAADRLEELVAKDPSTALYLPVAERMLARGQIAAAILLCEERRDRPGKGVGDHIVLGRCYLADGRLAQAREEFESALALDRENVVALKSMAGILSHDGRHAEASDLYRAVCRVDPGDLESQSALHQITSGEYAEVRPPEVIVSQGDLAWQPVRLTREEDHLSELALGLPTFDSLESGPLRPTSPFASLRSEPLLTPEELSFGPGFPRESAEPPRPETGPTLSPSPASSRHEIILPTDPIPAGGLHNRLGSLDVEEFQTSALERLDQVLRPAAVRALGEVSTPADAPVDAPPAAVEEIELPASALVDAPPRAPGDRIGQTRSAVWDEEVTMPARREPAPPPAAAPETPAPPAIAAPPAPEPPRDGEAEASRPTVEGNRTAFEMWLQRLGGKG